MAFVLLLLLFVAVYLAAKHLTDHCCCGADQLVSLNMVVGGIAELEG